MSVLPVIQLDIDNWKILDSSSIPQLFSKKRKLKKPHKNFGDTVAQTLAATLTWNTTRQEAEIFHFFERRAPARQLLYATYRTLPSSLALNIGHSADAKVMPKIYSILRSFSLVQNMQYAQTIPHEIVF